MRVRNKCEWLAGNGTVGEGAGCWVGVRLQATHGLIASQNAGGGVYVGLALVWWQHSVLCAQRVEVACLAELTPRRRHRRHRVLTRAVLVAMVRGSVIDDKPRPDAFMYIACVYVPYCCCVLNYYVQRTFMTNMSAHGV